MFDRHNHGHSDKHTIQLVAIVGVMICLIGYVVVSMTMTAIKEEQAKKLVLDNLKKAADAAERERKVNIVATKMLVKETLRVILQDKAVPDNDPVDAWGNQIRIVVDGEIGSGKCVVTSAGPDGKFETGDDIEDWKTTAMAVGKDIGKTTTNFGVGIIKGVVNSAKESVFGESK